MRERCARRIERRPFQHPNRSSLSSDPTLSGSPLADRRAAYAEDYLRAGDAAAAADLMRQALELAPGWTLGRVRLAAFEEAAGERALAVETLRQAISADADGRYGAALALASLGAAPVPRTAPAAYVEGLFDAYAPRFERSLVDKLSYRGPAILVEELARLRAPLSFTAALDLGCGTGLMGQALRPFVERLDGIDLSAEMLARARSKRLYDSLALGDLLAEAQDGGGIYDLVTAADVLIYIGDLSPVLSSVRRRLSGGGLFAFTIETHEGTEPYRLRSTLRFAHLPAVLRQDLEDAGFAVLRERRIVVRKDRGEDVAGLALIAGLQG